MVNILPSEEQTQIIDSVCEVLSRECSLDRLRAGRSPAREQELLNLFGELGWFRFGQPEARGGNDMDLTDEMLVFRELGRTLASPALLAQGIAADMLTELDQIDLAETLRTGAVKVGLGYVPPMSGPGEAVVEQRNDDLLLIDADGAEFVLIAEASRVSLVQASLLTQGQPLRSLDDSIDLRWAQRHGIAPLIVEESGRLQQRALLLWSAQLVGVAEMARNMAAEYAKTREQFGKLIGSFQAVAHHCANMALRSEAALCQTLFAAIVLRDKRDDARFHIAAAATVAGDAAFQNATLNIQVHGGIGFTAECHAQRLLKRAIVLRQLVGRSSAHVSTLLACEQPQ